MDVCLSGCCQPVLTGKNDPHLSGSGISISSLGAICKKHTTPTVPLCYCCFWLLYVWQQSIYLAFTSWALSSSCCSVSAVSLSLVLSFVTKTLSQPYSAMSVRYHTLTCWRRMMNFVGMLTCWWLASALLCLRTNSLYISCVLVVQWHVYLKKYKLKDKYVKLAIRPIHDDKIQFKAISQSLYLLLSHCLL